MFHVNECWRKLCNGDNFDKILNQPSLGHPLEFWVSLAALLALRFEILTLICMNEQQHNMILLRGKKKKKMVMVTIDVDHLPGEGN